MQHPNLPVMAPGVPAGHGAPHFHLNPRTVPEFLHNFKVALEDHFNTEDPGRTENYYCLGIFLPPRGNKRQLKIYITHSPRPRERKMTTMDYVMPVAPEFADTFGSPIARTLPSRGPTMQTHTLADDETTKDFIFRTVGPLAEPENRMSPWKVEMTKAQRARDTPPDADASEDTRHRMEERREKAGRFFEYWSAMYAPIMRTLGGAGIHVPGEDGQLSPAWRSPARSPAAAEMPALPVRSSSATRRRRSSARRRRMTRRKSNSDPSRLTPPNVYNTVPKIARHTRRNDNIFTLRNISNINSAAVKRVRRRRPNSDPKDD